jgi:hypothetical protein
VCAAWLVQAYTRATKNNALLPDEAHGHRGSADGTPSSSLKAITNYRQLSSILFSSYLPLERSHTARALRHKCSAKIWQFSGCLGTNAISSLFSFYVR